MEMDNQITITTITTSTAPLNPASILKQKSSSDGIGAKKLAKILIPKTVVVNAKDPPSSASSERCIEICYQMQTIF